MKCKKLRDLETTKQLIATGKPLALAGDEKVLAELPSGNWIGGTIPYFMTEDGGTFSQSEIFVTELPDYVKNAAIRTYTKESISKVYEDAPDNGLSVIIIPATCDTHIAFSLKAPTFPGFATRPLVGWISGVFLDELGTVSPRVYNGLNAAAIEDGAVVMHVTLPENKVAELGILNIFEKGDGDSIVFPENGFHATVVKINGQDENFAEYLQRIEANTRLPLVSDFYGANINTSFQSVEAEERKVLFYAPVFSGREYKLAKPMGDYVDAFMSRMPKDAGRIEFSCNCILNYLYSELEGRRTGGIVGPITFGEIAYQLLNQTLAYVTISDM